MSKASKPSAQYPPDSKKSLPLLQHVLMVLFLQEEGFEQPAEDIVSRKVREDEETKRTTTIITTKKFLNITIQQSWLSRVSGLTTRGTGRPNLACL